MFYEMENSSATNEIMSSHRSRHRASNSLREGKMETYSTCSNGRCHVPCHKLLSFRGSKETPSDLAKNSPQPNEGNFLNLISLLVNMILLSSINFNHLKKGYVCPICYKVRNTIFNEIKDANYFIIMFDCTPDISHTEQLSQVIRYIKITETGCEIKESFIEFIEVDGKSGGYTTQRMLEKLEAGLDVEKCRGQSYDNGSNMSGIYKGVQSRIMQMNELAEFVPCLGHSLNLVSVHAASICPQAVSLFGLVLFLCRILQAVENNAKVYKNKKLLYNLTEVVE